MATREVLFAAAKAHLPSHPAKNGRAGHSCFAQCDGRTDVVLPQPRSLGLGVNLGIKVIVWRGEPDVLG